MTEDLSMARGLLGCVNEILAEEHTAAHENCKLCRLVVAIDKFLLDTNGVGKQRELVRASWWLV